MTFSRLRSQNLTRELLDIALQTYGVFYSNTTTAALWCWSAPPQKVDCAEQCGSNWDAAIYRTSKIALVPPQRMEIWKDSLQDMLVRRLYRMALRHSTQASYIELATHDDWSILRLCDHSVVRFQSSCSCIAHKQYPGSFRSVFDR